MARSLRPPIVALALTPLAGAIVVVIWFLIFGTLLAPPVDGVGLPTIAAVFFAASLFSGYLASLVLGLPGYFLLRRLGWLRRRWWFLLGTVMGCASGTLMMAVVYAQTDARAHPAFFIVGAAILVAPLVLATGLVFMLLMRRSRVDVERIAATFD